MKKKNISLLIALIFTFSALQSCGDKEDQSQAAPIMPFPVINVPTKNVTSYESFPVKIEGEINSDIRPKVSGYIKKVYVEEGEVVRKGQQLFELETQSLSQDAQAAKASVNAAQVEVDKLKPLVEKNIISNVQLETAKARLQQAQSAYNGVIANINYAHVKSPVDGVVGSINFREGSLVSAQDPTPLTKVSSIDKVYAYFSMNEKDFLDFIASIEGKTLQEKIKKLPNVKLQLANNSVYEKEGEIETIAGDINQQTGTISFRALFDNSAGLLRNGSSGTLLIPRIFENALVIPAESTFERQGKKFVFKVVEDSLVETPISLQAEADNYYVVESGLEKEETILAKGLNKVRAGSKIKPMPTAVDSIINSFEPVFK